MTEFPIEQALFHRSDQGHVRLLARSAGFLDDWQPEVERLMAGFGARPEGIACPPAVFAQPLGKQNVAVVHVADQAGTLGFFFLVVPRRDYVDFLGDPFVVAERLAPHWQARDSLPSCCWPPQPLPPRSVRDIQAVLQRVKASALREDEEPLTVEQTVDNAESPALLGSVQILVDGGRVVFQRPGPDTRLLQGLWLLLPTRARSNLWPASFAFGNALQFDAVVVPRIAAEEYAGYSTEDMAAEYPAGRYELALQTAVEAGNQADLDALLSRRSAAETFRLVLLLLVLFVVIVVGTRLIDFGPGPPEDKKKEIPKAAGVAGLVAVANPWPVLVWKMHEDGLLAHKAAAAAGMIGAADPWTAIGLKLHGDQMFLKKP